MHADVHQSYTVDGVRTLDADEGMIFRFSRERKSCDLQDYHIDVRDHLHSTIFNILKIK